VSFFESLLVLLLAAVVLLQVARWLKLPYPAMLAGAGVLVAFLPGTPDIGIEPGTALALFIAPVVVDAAFDFPPSAALRFLGPLLALAVFAVLVTTALVATIGHLLMGLPIAAAIALGAIVAPPDAAAATTVLNTVSVPRSAEEVLKGESLFNDATALLLFSGSLTILGEGGLHFRQGLELAAAIPGGLLLGFLGALLFRFLNRFFRDTLGGNLLQFVGCYLIWLSAEHLHLSAVLCTIAFAMTLARNPEQRGFPRMRVQSFAVWSAVVFTLNVLAFLIMGMQARAIIHNMQTTPLDEALRFAGLIVLTVIVARLGVVVVFNRLASLFARRRGTAQPPGLRQAFFVGWSGMRGFVTLATAFALPSTFPQRDTVVLTAFAVVLGTLVLQGLTLRPLIRLLGLGDTDTTDRELNEGRAALAAVALRSLTGRSGPAADNLRFSYEIERASAQQSGESAEVQKRRALGLAAIAAERDELENLRNRNRIGITTYGQLQEELDWRELTLLRDEQRRIEET
jgi:monovalent cation/hydrogen antiporter